MNRRRITLREAQNRRRKRWLVLISVCALLLVLWVTKLNLAALQQTSQGKSTILAAKEVKHKQENVKANPSEEKSLRVVDGKRSREIGLRQVKVTDADSYYAATGRRDRVYCMIPTMYGKRQVSLWTAILKSWGRRCDIIKIFIDPVSDMEVESTLTVDGVSAEIVVVPMVRKRGEICADGLPCRHIWEKVWRSWQYVAKNDLYKAEWFLKIDDDTFFVPTNLRKWVRDKNWSHDDPHYFGHAVYVETGVPNLISGICTAFSREAIRRFGERLKTIKHEYGPRENFPNSHGSCVDRDGATEERVTSKCLAEVGVFAEEALENDKSETVIPLGLPFTLTYFRKRNSTSWYWHGKPWTRGDMFDCCSKNYSWGIHGYKGSGTRMLEMEKLLYKVTTVTLENSRDRNEHMSDLWAFYEYIRILRESIRKDPFEYPPDLKGEELFVES